VGSHIDSFFPRSVPQDPEIVLRRLNEVFGALQPEISAIRAWRRLSHESGDWWTVLVEAEPDQPMSVEGEGPCGFIIRVYAGTVCFTNCDKFGLIAYPEYGIAQPLRHVFRSVASALGAPGPFAVASGGYGETDRACDLAYYEAAPFERVCDRLEEDNGPPVRSWEDLEAGRGTWYLGGQVNST
jgi:hypothetical protein